MHGISPQTGSGPLRMGSTKGPHRAGLRAFSSGLLSWDPDARIPHGCSRHGSQLEVLKAEPPEHGS